MAGVVDSGKAQHLSIAPEPLDDRLGYFTLIQKISQDSEGN